MSAALVWLPVLMIVAAAMELWAGLLHGHFWHRSLWPVHRSHHRRRRGRFEANDALSVLHAPIAVALILYGCAGAPGIAREVCFGAGLGMTAFGLGYLIVHDGFVHGRLPVGWLDRLPLFARIREAHRVHHVRGEAPFGFFLGPAELARAHARARQSSRTRPAPQRPTSRGRSDLHTSR